MVESVSSNSSYSAVINSAVANQGSSTSTTSTTSTTATEISNENQTKLEQLGIDDSNITTNAEAKKAIEKAQVKLAKEAELLKGSESISKNDIKDTVDISKRALNALNAEVTE